MKLLLSNFISAFRNAVRLVYDRVLQLRQASFVLMWCQAVLGLYGYLTFKRL